MRMSLSMARWAIPGIGGENRIDRDLDDLLHQRRHPCQPRFEFFKKIDEVMGHGAISDFRLRILDCRILIRNPQSKIQN